MERREVASLDAVGVLEVGLKSGKDQPRRSSSQREASGILILLLRHCGLRSDELKLKSMVLWLLPEPMSQNFSPLVRMNGSPRPRASSIAFAFCDFSNDYDLPRDSDGRSLRTVLIFSSYWFSAELERSRRLFLREGRGNSRKDLSLLRFLQSLRRQGFPSGRFALCSSVRLLLFPRSSVILTPSARCESSPRASTTENPFSLNTGPSPRSDLTSSGFGFGFAT